MWHVLRNFNNERYCMYVGMYDTAYMAAGNSHDDHPRIELTRRVLQQTSPARRGCRRRTRLEFPIRRDGRKHGKAQVRGKGGTNREKIELRSSGKRTKLRAAKGIQPSRLLPPVSVVLRVIWSLSGLFSEKFLRSQSTFLLIYTDSTVGSWVVTK